MVADHLFGSMAFWDRVGRFGLFSTLRWSCIGREKAKAPQQRGFRMGKGLVLEEDVPHISFGCLNPANRVPVMISLVNPGESIVAARLLDYFSSRTH